MNHTLTRFRKLCVLLILGCIAGMAFALYLQHYQHLDPCPLCIFQRVGLIGMGVFGLLGLVTPTLWIGVKRLLAVLATLSIAWSIGVAGRHVWLQHLPADDVPACGPGLEYWLNVFPLQSVVQKVLHGSGECAKVDWTLLGMSLPHWALAYFVGLGVVCLALVVSAKR